MEILKRLDNESVIALVSIDKLVCHEGVKEDYLAALSEQIKNDGELYRPILVTKNDLVILDGHHRFLSCKNLGCKRITALVIDYFRPDVKVESWSPVILEKEESDKVFTTLKAKGFSITEVETEEKLHELVDSRQAAIGMIIHDTPLQFFVTDWGEDKTFSEAMKSIISDLRSRQKLSSLKYLDNTEKAKEMINNGGAFMLINVPRISKENVIKRSLMEEKYPPKTTRHLVPENVSEYHVSLDRLKQLNPEEDVEMSEEQGQKDEQHMREHATSGFISGIEYR